MIKMFIAVIIGIMIGLILYILLIPYVYYFVDRIWNAEEKMIRKHEARRFKKLWEKESKKLKAQILTEDMIIKMEEREE